MPSLLDVDSHLAHLAEQGDLLVTAATAGDPGAPVPACPGWTLRDILVHLGRIHRRVAMVVREPGRFRSYREITPEMGGPVPVEADLTPWYRAGLDEMATAIARLDPGEQAVPTFGPAVSPRAFWARRQAQEVLVHRIDVERAAGIPMTPTPPRLAADGIEELWDVFLPNLTRVRSEPATSLHLHATDTEGEWLLEVGPGAATVRREHARGDCAVRGTAAALHELVWNRRDATGLEVHGDPRVLERWRDMATI